jgi:predicted AAA+ superfamily ATPase
MKHTSADLLLAFHVREKCEALRRDAAIKAKAEAERLYKEGATEKHRPMDEEEDEREVYEHDLEERAEAHRAKMRSFEEEFSAAHPISKYVPEVLRPLVETADQIAGLTERLRS